MTEAESKTQKCIVQFPDVEAVNIFNRECFLGRLAPKVIFHSKVCGLFRVERFFP